MTPFSFFGPARAARLFGVLAAVLTLLVTGEAAAQKKKNVVELNEITITGRVQKPVAAVDISRMGVRLSLNELRQPFLDRIEQAVYRDPFLR